MNIKFYKTKALFIVMLIILSMLSLFLFTNLNFYDVANAETINLNSNEISDLVEKIENDDGSYVYSINESNFNLIKNLNGKVRGAKTKIINDLLLNIGFLDTELYSFSEYELLNIINNCKSLTVNTQYVKIMDENVQIMDKNSCLNEVANVNNNIASKATGNSQNTVDFSFMKVTTMSVYLNGDSLGWYDLFGIFSWLTSPSKRNHEDAASVYCSNVAWSQNSNDFYSTLSYTAQIVNTSGVSLIPEAQTKTTQDKVLKTDGLYYMWSLPKDSYNSYLATSISFNNFIVKVKGKARVNNYTLPTAFNVFTRYVHLSSYFIVKPTFGWTLGSAYPGVTLDGGWSVKKDEAYGYNYNDYTLKNR